ncbi:MAG: hypothetical protein ACRDRL_10115, partial [Sciscionella sp.]
MPVAPKPGSTTQVAAGGGGSSGTVPFIVATNEYSEPFFTYTFTISAISQTPSPFEITPGGFLRGINLSVVGAGGVAGTPIAGGDAPWTLFGSLDFENIDGSPILYPMPGYSHFVNNKYLRDWELSPDVDPLYTGATAPNYALNLRLWPEVRDTAGVLANTDARAQFRHVMVINPD